MYPAFQLIGAPLLGRMSDTHGRREILLISQLGTLIAWIIFLVAFFLPRWEFSMVNNPYIGIFVLTLPLLVLFFARALDGITGGNVSVAHAYLADVTPEKDRSKNFGKMSISVNLGFIVGPALAGILGATIYGEIVPVFAAMLISLVATIVIIIYLPESKPCAIEKDHEKLSIRNIFGHEHKECMKTKNQSINFKDILKIKHVPYMLVFYFITFLGFNIFYTAFPIHAIQGLNWSITEMGIFFSVLSFSMIIVQGPVLSRVSKRFSDGPLVVVGSIILGTNFLLLTSPNTVLIYTAVIFFAVGNGLMLPSFLSIVSKVAGKKYQGSVQGFTGSFGSLASIIGLISGGILYTTIGASTFFVSAAIIYISFILPFRFLKWKNL